jgi:hypothetical protein
MPTTITLPGDLETRYRAEAQREGVPMEVWAARRLEENELLWRIRIAVPDDETRELHRLLRKQRSGIITEAERECLLTLVEARERQAAQRMEDLGALARLRGIPVRELMNRLGIRPIPVS